MKAKVVVDIFFSRQRTKIIRSLRPKTCTSCLLQDGLVLHTPVYSAYKKVMTNNKTVLE
jgi:hypothetical protein